MTNERAIELLTNAIQTEHMTVEQDKALAISQKSLEKQIPKKPRKESICSSNAINGWYKWHCPNCNKMLGVINSPNKSNFCPNCGQALDWS